MTDGVDAALRQAREAANDLDVQIAGGAEVVRQALFETGEVGTVQLELISAQHDPATGVIHTRYRAIR